LTFNEKDAVILVARADQEYSALEVHVYNEESGDLYVHHDTGLPAFPLCVEWLDCPCHAPTQSGGHETGSYAAVGSFNPQIEIWNLDVLNALEPSAVLGGRQGQWSMIHYPIFVMSKH